MSHAAEDRWQMATLLSVRIQQRIVVAVSLAVALAGVAAGCGDDVDEAQQRKDVQQVVERFGQAFAKGDGATICGDLLAEDLQTAVEGIGLACEEAIKRSTSGVKDAKLEVLGVAVRGDRGFVTARTTAKGQEPSVDRLALVQTDDGWRITSLNTEDELAPEERPKPSDPVTIGRTTPTVIDRTVTVGPETPITP